MFASTPADRPVPGTVEAWAEALIEGTSLDAKLRPPPIPSRWSEGASPRRIARPGRPPELLSIARPPKTPRPGALRDPGKRAQLLHTFFHHELQAAELMAWALLAFPDTPPPFRQGLLRICTDELRHARAYAEHLARLGSRVGAFGVRDWFWERVPRVERPAEFVALLGIGFEGANLDHSARFARAFRAAGDEEGALLQERVGREEIPHVRFAAQWFERWVGPLTFEAWRGIIPPPLSPIVMRGTTIEHAARARAGLPADFVLALEAWNPG